MTHLIKKNTNFMLVHIKMSLLFVLLLGQLTSCQVPDNILKNVFNNRELQTIDKIIEYYDNFVISQTDEKLPIDKAYIVFLDKLNPSVEEIGDMSLLLPDTNQRFKFFKTIDKKSLSEIYNIQDSVTIYRKTDKGKTLIKEYKPFTFSLNCQGKYLNLLKELSKRNAFFKNYYQNILACGDICPTNYSAILKGYNSINFNKREERLVLIVNFLRTP
jgi:hypothetical protein